VNMSKIRMSFENLVGMILFFFISLAGFLRITDAVVTVSDSLVVRSLQIVSLIVVVLSIFVFLRFEAYSNQI